MYDVHGFSGNSDNYYSPLNYYINQVMETKKGNPVSLAIIYSILALKLDIPIYGVNLPKNFILAYKDKYATRREDEILFYINPYNRGAVLGKREIDYFLKQQNLTPIDGYYYPCSNISIIQRLLVNLVNSYESLGQHDKMERLKQLLKLFDNA
jgi:regulator of sirC expression with transglutaminase-like and TPR domain